MISIRRGGHLSPALALQVILGLTLTALARMRIRSIRESNKFQRRHQLSGGRHSGCLHSCCPHCRLRPPRL